MLYAADVFLSPIRKVEEGKRLRGSVGAIRRLAKVHRQALLAVTGVMRTVATDTMEAHANLLPLKLIVDKLCFQAAARMCTLPPTHPLRSHVQWAYKHSNVKRHRAPLHDLFRAFKPHLPISRMETIRPTRRHPRWIPYHKVSIADTKEKAEEEDRDWARKRGIRVYSDGSDIDGGVGAAAVLIRPDSRRKRCLQHFLGPSSEHMVYEAETVGAILGIELLRTERSLARHSSVALDGLSAIQATQAINPRSGHHLTDSLTNYVAVLSTKHEDTQLTLRWVPGHYDIEGNELADEAAKEAARGTSSARARLPKPLRAPLPITLSKVKQNHTALLRAQAAKEWSDSTRGRRFKDIDAAMPSKAFDRLIAGLSRRLTCALIQLRTGHAPLNEHLHRIGKAESALCPACGREPESVAHFLLRCTRFDVQRWRCFAPLGRDGRKLPILLNSEKGLKPLFDYVNATGRLRGTFGALELRDDTDDN